MARRRTNKRRTSRRCHRIRAKRGPQTQMLKIMPAIGIRPAMLPLSPAAPSDPEAQKQLDQHIARLESLKGPEHARVRHWVIARTLIRA